MGAEVRGGEGEGELQMREVAVIGDAEMKSGPSLQSPAGTARAGMRRGGTGMGIGARGVSGGGGGGARPVALARVAGAGEARQGWPG